MRLVAAILLGLLGVAVIGFLGVALLPPAAEGIVLFAVVVLLVIFFHEAGHFVAAKAFGIKVQEFFIGFGPRVWSFRRGETEYGLKAFPAGGYVRIAGMNPFEEPPPEDRGRLFSTRPPWQRAIVLVAGSLTHFVLAFFLLTVFFSAVGIPERFAPRVAAVERRLDGRVSPAAEAGLRPGDEFIEVDGQPVTDYEQFVRYTRERAGQEISVTVDREGRAVRLRVTPVEDLVEGQVVGRMGIILSPGRILERDRVNPITGSARAGSTMADMIVRSVQGIGQVFGPEGLGRLASQLFGEEPRNPERDPAGVVGAARISGQAAAAGAFEALFFLFASFNVFVGLLNLLPLPPLDGGHLAVVGVEKITGKRVDARRLLPVTAVVVAFLLFFFVAVTFLDITEPLPNPFE